MAGGTFPRFPRAGSARSADRTDHSVTGPLAAAVRHDPEAEIGQVVYICHDRSDLTAVVAVGALMLAAETALSQ